MSLASPSSLLQSLHSFAQENRKWIRLSAPHIVCLGKYTVHIHDSAFWPGRDDEAIRERRLDLLRQHPRANSVVVVYKEGKYVGQGSLAGFFKFSYDEEAWRPRHKSDKSAKSAKLKRLDRLDRLEGKMGESDRSD